MRDRARVGPTGEHKPLPRSAGLCVLVAMVCEEPMIQVAFTGLGVAAPPSTETVSPAGAVVIVIGTEPGLMVVESLEVSFAALISPPPATVTLLVTEAGAFSRYAHGQRDCWIACAWRQHITAHAELSVEVASPACAAHGGCR